MDYDASPLPAVYTEARALPAAAARAWSDAIRRLVPPRLRGRVLDLGCGTGRFTTLLGEVFGGRVIGVEPSLAMLRERGAEAAPHARFVAGAGEALPLRAGAVDLAFLSMVYHHFRSPADVAAEVRRVLRRGGHVVVRTPTQETLDGYEYLRFFPEAIALDRRRLPARDAIRSTFDAQRFAPIAHEMVPHLFAIDYAHYYRKVSLRGLSNLAAIPDDAFERGLRLFEAHCRTARHEGPIYEPVDLFVFEARPA